jgi:formylglycine-generating enzyme required for sulfatase activity
MAQNRPLRIFISYASQDRLEVQKLYQRLKSEPWIEVWFDKENLLPGQDWNLEISKGLRAADVIIVCLSKESVAKEGYVQKEFKRAADYADEKPEGTIYLIPLRLDDCVAPPKFEKWQWVDYFTDGAHERLLKALVIRAQGLKIPITQVELTYKGGKSVKMGEALSMTMESQIPPEIMAESAPKSTPTPTDNMKLPVGDLEEILLDVYRFIKISSHAVPEPFWIGKYPVTNAQYERFLKSDDFAKSEFWTSFPKFDENCKAIGDWGDEGLKWLKEQLKDYEYFPHEMWKVKPRFLDDHRFGIANPDNPVVGISWYEANAYCNWLFVHWFDLPESQINPDLKSALIRLPLETEWIAAAGGNKPENRYPWDLPGEATADEKEISKRANVSGKIGHTTPVTKYSNGKSPFGVMDMSGNVLEWQANLDDEKGLSARGGSWGIEYSGAHVSVHHSNNPNYRNIDFGFRAVVLPK